MSSIPFTHRFETALRLKDPSVSVPYWASNLDHEMDEPTKSIIWSEKFLGNGDGFVTTGAFADFKVHSTDSILTRNIGASGSLMTNQGIHDILSQNHTADITNPKAPLSHNLELQHNMLHVWVGGNMDDLSMSGEDPVFYLHHSFVDYLWEEFRTRQKILKIDPELDYPSSNWGSEQHAPEALLGFGDLRNVDALSDAFADLVKYEPSPVCSRTHPTCGSKYLRCDLSNRVPVCVSLSREDIDSGNNDSVADTCLESHLTRAVQNSFAINQFCDIRRWAYIPVEIILQRPPEFKNYKSYPVVNNRPVKTSDVFSTVSINKTISKTLATYPDCKSTTSVARNIYIESYGLNYYGKYKDFTVLDQRHALSKVTAYLGVKSPESNHTDVIVYAYDYCGRSCRPFCLDLTSNPPEYRPCSGVVRITTEEPKMYGDNYAEAVNHVWEASHPDSLPTISTNNAFVTFYCDFSGVWPWNEAIQKRNFKKKKKTKKDEKGLDFPKVPLARKGAKSGKKQKIPEVKVIKKSKVNSNNKNKKSNKKQKIQSLKVPASLRKTSKSSTRPKLASARRMKTFLDKSHAQAKNSRSRSRDSTTRTRSRSRVPTITPRSNRRTLQRERTAGPVQRPLQFPGQDFNYFRGRSDRHRPPVKRPLFRLAFYDRGLSPFAPDLFQFSEGPSGKETSIYHMTTLVSNAI